MSEKVDDLSKLTKKELQAKLEAQQEENNILRQAKENPTVEINHDEPQSHVSYNEFESEMEKLQKIATHSDPYRLELSEKLDHPGIMLYTALNKRVGPLHPNNAVATMRRWKSAGVQLYTVKRTDEQVKAFMETEEYKTYIKKFHAERKKRRQNSEKGRVENLVQQVAKETASSVAQAVAGAKNGN